MTGIKTVAERLRETEGESFACDGDLLAFALGRKLKCPNDIDCRTCIVGLASDLADAIEAEQAQAVSKSLIEEVFKPDSISIGLLRDVAKELEEYAQMIEGATSEDLSHYAWLIQNALKGAKPQLPEGVIWPRFEDGELVKFGDKFDHVEGYRNIPVERITFRADGWVDVSQRGGIYQPLRPGEHLKRPEPEALDADGVPIKVGDTVWYEGDRECVVERIYRQNGDTLLDLDICGSILNMVNVKPAEVTHRKPDTQGAIEDDTTLPPKEYCSRYHLLGADGAYFDDAEAIEAMCKHLIEHTRKLLGGE